MLGYHHYLVEMVFGEFALSVAFVPFLRFVLSSALFFHFLPEMVEIGRVCWNDFIAHAISHHSIINSI